MILRLIPFVGALAYFATAGATQGCAGHIGDSGPDEGMAGPPAPGLAGATLPRQDLKKHRSDDDDFASDPVWQDDFDGDSLDETRWNLLDYPCDRVWGSQNACFVDHLENANTDGHGHLRIRARRESWTPQPWTSAQITTRNKGDFLYGKIEARMKMPAGAGTFPAFWMMPTDATYGKWPRSGELDIVEHIGRNVSQTLNTLHWGPAWNEEYSAGGLNDVEAGTLSDDWHNFGVLWYPDHIAWTMDGEVLRTFSKDDVDWRAQAPYANGDWVFGKRFYLILDLAMGGPWPGPVDPALQQPELLVDWVKVYPLK